MAYNGGGEQFGSIVETIANMRLRTWSAKDIKRGTRVLLRVDANVPLVKGLAQDGGKFGRIAQSIPEIDRLRKRGAIIILASHLGDPGGKPMKGLSLAPVAKVYEKHLKGSVPLVKDWQLPALKPRDICFLENLRFHPGEEANDDAFAWKLAKLADVYVNNAFGVCHRRHASVHAVTRHLPSFAGELVVREVTELARPTKAPFILVMGGAKIATKINVLKRLGTKADKILLGGGLAVTFLAAAGATLPTYPKDLVVEQEFSLARRVIRQYSKKIFLPEDLVAEPKEKLILDIGPTTAKCFSEQLQGAKSIIWNGPLGIIEKRDGQDGTRVVAKAIARQKTAHSIVGGGETIAFLEASGLNKNFSHVSTGGGAMLAFLGGETLPGLETLRV